MMRLACWAGSQAKAGAARESLPECQTWREVILHFFTHSSSIDRVPALCWVAGGSSGWQLLVEFLVVRIQILALPSSYNKIAFTQ